MQFQDDSRCTGAVLLPILYLMSLQSSEVQNLSTNQISSTYLNPWLRYNYFRFGKTNVRHFWFFFHLSGYYFDHIIVIGVLSGYWISSKSGHPLRSNYVIYNFKMEAEAAPYHFRLRTCWRQCLRKIKFYLKTKLHPNRTIRGDGITS